VAQLPQSGYQALGTPYSYFGLGRTNNYVERLFVGSSLNPPEHYTILEALIPNSQLIINPPYPVLNGSDVDIGRPTEWRSELYLHPGDWVPWVAAAVAGAVAILGFVVLGLRAREQVSDCSDCHVESEG
jgi:integrin alpha FG-GAP repeat containing protein 1